MGQNGNSLTRAKEDVFESHRRETMFFPPPAAFLGQARLKSLEEYERMYARSIDNPAAFWGDAARELEWFKPWERVLDETGPHARWFTGGKLNVTHNCLDRHLRGLRRDKIAVIWEGEPCAANGSAEVRRLSYRQLHEQVQRLANVLKSLGVKKGDRVGVYMGMSPELVMAMLACARIGAVHCVIFGGFAPQAIADRVRDSDCSVVLTQDVSYRAGAVVRLKEMADEALEMCPDVHSVVVYQREPKTTVAMKAGRDLWWHEAMAAAAPDCPPEWMDAEDPLYILYTSGTTGKPKGLVHGTGGYAVQTYLSAKYVFDLCEEDVYWCTADLGWVTGHSYVLYGPLQNGATVMLYEGTPMWPERDRYWRIVDDHKVSVFYTAPTTIRAFVGWGTEWIQPHDLSSLRLLGTVGEPINPEAWMWCHSHIGKGRCPIVDTWWQTETGSIMIAPIPGAVATKPGSATRPFFGVIPEIVSQDGEPVGPNEDGLLTLKRPWPSMARTIWKNPELYEKTYFPKGPGVYVTGDGARCDEDGYYWLMGRLDDVINVSGHRLGTAEIESALGRHPGVAEAAVVGRPDELKGQAVAAFVTLKEGLAPSPDLKQELRQWVSKEIGALARPDDLRFVPRLPKTRSGKIVRRLLRELATTGTVKGDTTTLEDESVLEQLYESEA